MSAEPAISLSSSRITKDSSLTSTRNPMYDNDDIDDQQDIKRVADGIKEKGQVVEDVDDEAEDIDVSI